MNYLIASPLPPLHKGTGKLGKGENKDSNRIILQPSKEKNPFFHLTKGDCFVYKRIENLAILCVFLHINDFCTSMKIAGGAHFRDSLPHPFSCLFYRLTDQA